MAGLSQQQSVLLATLLVYSWPVRYSISTDYFLLDVLVSFVSLRWSYWSPGSFVHPVLYSPQCKTGN